MTPGTMLDNAAAASQNKSLLDDGATRGAILRSVAQFIETFDLDDDKEDMLEVLQNSLEYHR